MEDIDEEEILDIDSSDANNSLDVVEYIEDLHSYYRIMETPDIDPSRDEPTKDEIIDSYVKTLAEVVGSEDEARMMVYSDIITTDHYSFGTLLSEELYDRVEALPRVVMILPDDPVVNINDKAYGDGKVAL